MNEYPLAILASRLGARSETFIRRHAQDLLPGKTVLVAHEATPGSESAWEATGPSLIIEGIQPGRLWRLRQAVRGRHMARKMDQLRLARVERFLQQHSVKVVMGEYLNRSLPYLKHLKSRGFRVWGHAHGYDVSQVLRSPAKCAAYQWYRHADGVITMSEASRRRLVDIGLPAEKVWSVPYGVDVPEAPVSKPRRDVVKCLAVGRMVAKKAPILMLEGFRRATEALPNIHLDLVGEGTLFPAVKDFVHAFDLADRVTVHGGQPPSRVLELMKEADLFIQHSVVDAATGDEEGLPVAILEAMALGLPVVSTRHAGIPEEVTDETGILVGERDVVGFAEAIKRLSTDRERRQAMSMAGWRRVKEHFSWELEKRRLSELLFGHTASR